MLFAGARLMTSPLIETIQFRGVHISFESSLDFARVLSNFMPRSATCPSRVCGVSAFETKRAC